MDNMQPVENMWYRTGLLFCGTDFCSIFFTFRHSISLKIQFKGQFDTDQLVVLCAGSQPVKKQVSDPATQQVHHNGEDVVYEMEP